MKKCKVGVIGTGVMGREHVRVYGDLASVDLIGFYDADPARGALISESFHTRYFESLSALLSQVDVVSICTPTSTHYDIAKETLSRSIHTLIEKPIVSDPHQGKELIDLAKSHGVYLTVGHIERFNPIIPVLKKSIENSHVISINITRVGPIPPRVKDVGIILDLGVHDIDIISYLMGSTFQEIHALSSRQSGKYEDAAILSFKLENGTIASIVTNWFTPFKLRQIEIALTDRLLVGDFVNQEVKEYLGYKEGGYVTNSLQVQKKEPLKEELAHFVETIATGGKVLVTPEQALYAVETALACVSQSHPR